MTHLKTWTVPQLIVHGGVEDITAKIKPKTPGASDDFGVTGVSDP
ncbi:MAG: hypothetical protein WCD18_08020 [Thermosynechococcaceae cyanobacterium]